MFKRSVTACLYAMTCASVSLAQSITVVEPRTGNFEYIGQGNAGDNAFVYVTLSGLALGGVVETAGFEISYFDAAGNPVGGIVNIADLVADDQFGLCQQVPGGGDGDNNIESGETWSVNIAAALGGAIPLGASLISITFDPAGTPASTVANADGTSAGGTDAIDGRLQIITTRATPTAAFFDGTGATSQMFVTYTTPAVGFVSPNTAAISLFGNQWINGLAVASANSARVGGGAGTDFEFTDGNNFNSATGLAGTADIQAGSFSQPAGATNVLQFQFDDTASGLKSGRAFRVDTATTTVRDSAGNQVNNTTIVASQLLPLAATSAIWLKPVPADGSVTVDALQITFNRPLNSQDIGDIAFYADANGIGNSIRRLAHELGGIATPVQGLDVVAARQDARFPTRLVFDVSAPQNPSDAVGSLGTSVGSGDLFVFAVDAQVGDPPSADFGTQPDYSVTQNTTLIIWSQIDCNENGITDSDENGDCDQNALLDECEIEADPSLDRDADGQLDSCQYELGGTGDCNGNGIYDVCEWLEEPSLDCDADLVLDSCQVLLEPQLDCDGDERLDSCQTLRVDERSPELSPLGTSAPVAWTFSGLPEAGQTATLVVTTRGDFGAATEWLDVFVNGVDFGRVFQFDGKECGISEAYFALDASSFNLITETGTLEVVLVPSVAVDAFRCPDASFAHIALTYQAITQGDCDGNGLPDVCDIAYGTAMDGNDNGVPDECEGVQPCSGDVNGDWSTDSADFVVLAGNFGVGPELARADGDLNGDGTVNASDFIILAGDFGCSQ